MDVRNCRKCGKIFNYINGAPICPACKSNLESQFQEVKEYIRKNKEATIIEVSEECDVSTKQIRQWVREERLSFTNNSEIGIECERCGVTIKTGRFCNKCKHDMQHNLGSAYQEKQGINIDDSTKQANRMRYLSKDM